MIAGTLLFAVKRSTGMGSNWIKSKQGNLQSSEKDCCDSLDYRGLDAHFTNGGESLPIVQTHTNSLVPPSHPIYNPFSSHKTVSLNFFCINNYRLSRYMVISCQNQRLDKSQSFSFSTLILIRMKILTLP